MLESRQLAAMVLTEITETIKYLALLHQRLVAVVVEQIIKALPAAQAVVILLMELLILQMEHQIKVIEAEQA